MDYRDVAPGGYAWVRGKQRDAKLGIAASQNDSTVFEHFYASVSGGEFSRDEVIQQLNDQFGHLPPEQEAVPSYPEPPTPELVGPIDNAASHPRDFDGGPAEKLVSTVDESPRRETIYDYMKAREADWDSMSPLDQKLSPAHGFETLMGLSMRSPLARAAKHVAGRALGAVIQKAATTPAHKLGLALPPGKKRVFSGKTDDFGQPEYVLADKTMEELNDEEGNPIEPISVLDFTDEALIDTLDRPVRAMWTFAKEGGLTAGMQGLAAMADPSGGAARALNTIGVDDTFRDATRAAVATLRDPINNDPGTMQDVVEGMVENDQTEVLGNLTAEYELPGWVPDPIRQQYNMLNTTFGIDEASRDRPGQAALKASMMTMYDPYFFAFDAVEAVRIARQSPSYTKNLMKMISKGGFKPIEARDSLRYQNFPLIVDDAAINAIESGGVSTIKDFDRFNKTSKMLRSLSNDVPEVNDLSVFADAMIRSRAFEVGDVEGMRNIDLLIDTTDLMRRQEEIVATGVDDTFDAQRAFLADEAKSGSRDSYLLDVVSKVEKELAKRGFSDEQVTGLMKQIDEYYFQRGRMRDANQIDAFGKVQTSKLLDDAEETLRRERAETEFPPMEEQAVDEFGAINEQTGRLSPPADIGMSNFQEVYDVRKVSQTHPIFKVTEEGSDKVLFKSKTQAKTEAKIEEMLAENPDRSLTMVEGSVLPRQWEVFSRATGETIETGAAKTRGEALSEAHQFYEKERSVAAKADAYLKDFVPDPTILDEHRDRIRESLKDIYKGGGGAAIPIVGGAAAVGGDDEQKGNPIWKPTAEVLTAIKGVVSDSIHKLAMEIGDNVTKDSLVQGVKTQLVNENIPMTAAVLGVVEQQADLMLDGGSTRPEPVQELNVPAQVQPGPQPQLSPTSVVGRKSRVVDDLGNDHPVQYELIELDELVPSHISTGDRNEQFPNMLRAPKGMTDDELSQSVGEAAQNLNPSVLLAQTAQPNAGPPIVGPDRVVESGSQRVRMLSLAAESGQIGGYLEELEQTLPSFGIDPAKISSMANPVLIRSRQWGIRSRSDRAEWVRSTNRPTGGRNESLARLGRLSRELKSQPGASPLLGVRALDGLPDASDRSAIGKAYGNTMDLRHEGIFEYDADGVSHLTAKGRDEVASTMLTGAISDPDVVFRLLESE